MIHRERLTANIDGDFVVFLIGMRVNQPLKIHKWLPVARAMPRMIRELSTQPELGFLHAEMWFSRNIMMVQYWRSMDQLLAYAHNKQAQHLPAWKAFNQSIGTDGSVGIWHETYAATAAATKPSTSTCRHSGWAGRAVWSVRRVKSNRLRRAWDGDCGWGQAGPRTAAVPVPFVHG